jgi:ankyrin repeat protein
MSSGGDVNVTDNDGDTPLYTVEDVPTARFLVEHGAIIARQNLEGVSVRPSLHFSKALG